MTGLLGTVLVASTVIGLLSALRVLGVADAYGVDFEDRAFRIALIALRIYVIGALVFAVWEIRRANR